MVRARGSSKSVCTGHCNRKGDSGCSLKVNGFTYGMCQARKDFTKDKLDKMMSQDSCKEGCAMDPPAHGTCGVGGAAGEGGGSGSGSGGGEGSGEGEGSGSSGGGGEGD